MANEASRGRGVCLRLDLGTFYFNIWAALADGRACCLDVDSTRKHAYVSMTFLRINKQEVNTHIPSWAKNNWIPANTI